MVRTVSLAIVALWIGTSAAADAPRFKFQKGETLAYHLVQTTKIRETVLDVKTNKPVDSETSTTVDVQRKWKVTEVDDKGVATLEMSIASMRWEQKLPSGETDVFDSTKPDELNKTEMAKHVGPVLAVLKIDSLGRLVEVKESKVGPATRFAADLPFKIVLPDAEPKPGESWDRAYTIQLDPPHGTGEKYASVQKYTCQEPKSGLLAFGLGTTIKEWPTESADQIPLLPLMPQGSVYFHPATGRYYAARLKVEKELKNHQGEGSKYAFVSTYVEDLVPAK